MFADKFLPVYDVPGEVVAEPQVVWEALPGAGLVEVGKFWRPVIECTHVPAGRFRGFGEPGHAKTSAATGNVRPVWAPEAALQAGVRASAAAQAVRQCWRYIVEQLLCSINVKAKSPFAALTAALTVRDTKGVRLCHEEDGAHQPPINKHIPAASGRPLLHRH